MALSAGIVWEFRATATANMVNGGGYSSGGTDYSLQDAAQWTGTDGTGTASTNFSSATSTFTSAAIGNVLHITAGTGATVGWYEITGYVNANNITLDRAFGTTSNATFYIGGALDLAGSLADSFFEAIKGGNTVWIKNGTYALGGNISISSSASSITTPSNIIGYNSTRGDNPKDDTRPLITSASKTMIFGTCQNISNIRVRTDQYALTPGTNTTTKYCKVTNTGTTAGYVAITLKDYATLFASEAVSQNGQGIGSNGTGTRIVGCYIHDCNQGMYLTGTSQTISKCIVENCKTDGIYTYGGSQGAFIEGNTIYGTEAKIGSGITIMETSATAAIYNNNIYGCVNGIIQETAQQFSNFGAFNNFYNCTTDVTRYTKDATDIAVNPSFTGATQITGTTATTAASVLTQAGGDFSTVTDNIDYLRVFSGTGVTTGCYLITSHDATTLTVNNALGTSSAGNVVYSVGTGHNFAVGTNLKATGFPGLYPGSETTSYLDTGAVQRQEPAASAGGGSYPFVG